MAFLVVDPRPYRAIRSHDADLPHMVPVFHRIIHTFPDHMDNRHIKSFLNLLQIVMGRITRDGYVGNAQLDQCFHIFPKGTDNLPILP